MCPLLVDLFSYIGTIMEQQRESGVFYRSFYEAGKSLTEEQRGKYYTLIFNYMFEFERWTSEDPIVNAMFLLIAPQVEANIRKYFNWIEPKDKQEWSKDEAKDKQRWSKRQGNVDVDVNDDVDAPEKILKARSQCSELLISWGYAGFSIPLRRTADHQEARKKLNKKKIYYDEYIQWLRKYWEDITKRNQSQDYAKHRFSLLQFLKQGNGLVNFI